MRHYVGGIYDRVYEHHIFLLAGGLAFSLFVCIVPLVLIVFAALGQFIERSSITDEIHTFLIRLIPYPEYAAYVEELILQRVGEFHIYKNVAGIIGLVGLIFASTGLFSSMRTILNSVYQVQLSGPVFMGKLRDLGLIVLVLIYFLLSTLLLPAWSIIREIAGSVQVLSWLNFSGIEDVAIRLFSFAVIFGAYFIIYFAIPEKRPPRKVILISALTASILWEIARYLFGLYITNVATLKRIYGAYALTIVSAFWIYYTSLVFIISAEIGQLVRERQAKREQVVN